MYKTIYKEIIRGKSLLRTLQNIALSDVTISGKGLDLGAKSKHSSYYRFLNIEDSTELTFTDFNYAGDGILKIDLEKIMPIDDETQDFLLLNNVLEHLFDYKTCISECYRILKKDGRLIGVVPFFYRIHYDPDDYFRYTASTLKKLFSEAGFSDIEIKPLSCGPVSTGVAQFGRILKIKPIVATIYIIAILIDKLLGKFIGNHKAVKAENFPLSYFFICKK